MKTGNRRTNIFRCSWPSHSVECARQKNSRVNRRSISTFPISRYHVANLLLETLQYSTVIISVSYPSMQPTVSLPRVTAQFVCGLFSFRAVKHVHDTNPQWNGQLRYRHNKNKLVRLSVTCRVSWARGPYPVAKNNGGTHPSYSSFGQVITCGQIIFQRIRLPGA